MLHLIPILADDAGRHELHDLVADRRVLHVLVERARVGARLLEDGPHDGVAEDLLQLGIGLDALLDIGFGVVGASRKGAVDAAASLLNLGGKLAICEYVSKNEGKVAKKWRK